MMSLIPVALAVVSVWEQNCLVNKPCVEGRTLQRFSAVYLPNQTLPSSPTVRTIHHQSPHEIIHCRPPKQASNRHILCNLPLKTQSPFSYCRLPGLSSTFARNSSSKRTAKTLLQFTLHRVFCILFPISIVHIPILPSPGCPHLGKLGLSPWGAWLMRTAQLDMDDLAIRPVVVEAMGIMEHSMFVAWIFVYLSPHHPRVRHVSLCYLIPHFLQLREKRGVWQARNRKLCTMV